MSERMSPAPAASSSPRAIHLTPNARVVLTKRYLRRGPDGKPIESVEEMFERISRAVAEPDVEHGSFETTETTFFDLLTTLRFFPNSPTFTGAGTPLGQLAACFVLPIDDDMGREADGIFQTLRNAALIQQTGGGNGFSFSRLRPKGDFVATSAGTATGPVGFLRVYDKAFGEVAQGGCLLPDTLVFTNRGLLRLDELVNPDQMGWQEHTVQVATDEGWRTSPRGYNNGEAPVYRIHTREGVSIAGTANHKVKVMTRDGLVWRAIEDLKPNDWLAVTLGEHRGEFQALRSPQPHHANQKWPTFPTVLDEELAFFLGYLSGDGFVASREHDYRVGVTVAHSSYLMDEMPALMQRLFGVTPNSSQKPNDASLNLVLDNRGVKEFMLLNGFGKARSRNVSVPRLIRQSPPEVVGAYLRGLLEADGALVHGYPSLITTSTRLAEEVATLLIGLGCPVQTRTVSAGLNRYGTAQRYQVIIRSTVGLEAWRQRIGCDRRSRFVVAYQWRADEDRESVYPLPQPAYWLEPTLAAITLEQIDSRGRGLGRKWRSTSPALRKTLLRYIRGERGLTRSAYDRLVHSYPEVAATARQVGKVWFVRITGVESMGTAPTLDLEVNDNHTYLANGLVVHNSRRGANMAVLRVDHPDIMEFIRCKAQEGQISNFNISVALTDDFMQAVKNDAEFDLINPRDQSLWKRVRARDVFDEIVKYAHHNGEPGCLFIDTANAANPVPHLYALESTNPCGEQWLGPYENCCLGSINLAQHVAVVDGKRVVDWEKLQRTAEEATHFLDNVVSANKYVPAVSELRRAALRARRIGLGIMGLGDMMYALGVRYGSPAGEEFAGQIMEFVRYHCMRTSVKLAEERGPFESIRGSIYDPDDLKWQPPTPIAPYSHDWGRPAVDWGEIVDGIRRHGIRNAAQTTIAPTGTIATVAGCEGYGCEPVFALAYTRHVKDPNGGPDIDLTYASPLFEQALIETGIDEEARQKIYDKVMRTGTCQDIAEVPPSVRDTFAVAGDITPEEHVRTQAAMQAFVDNSLSKTCNFPEGATEEDVAKAFMMAWELGCKGLTVYVTGSREQVVLETKQTQEAKQQAKLPVVVPKPRERQSVLTGKTYRMETPIGTAYVTINECDGEPYEVFINVGKGGSDVAAVSEALGRLCSLELQTPSPLSARDRAKEIVHKLRGISGSQAIGFGPQRVASLPDAIAVALSRYIEADAEQAMQLPLTAPATEAVTSAYTNGNGKSVHRDLCPECGQATLMHEEGCRHCISCGYSKC